MGYNRQNKLKSEKFNENITKRGQVNAALKKKEEEEKLGPKMSPLVVGVLIFVLIGSVFFQVIKNMTSGPLF